jgi:gamma-glutamyltranspeptidase/glutathione hydrolase
MFERGGNAVDAAIATNAAIAVTGPHLCGMGGDLFALVHDGDQVVALNSSGRAGSGADADALRAEGHTTMPYRHDIRTVTVPGCVDGWCALHDRFGSLPLADILGPAIDLAENGFPASPLLVGASSQLDTAARENLAGVADARRVGAAVHRPRVAAALRSIVTHGRDGFYGGQFGAGLLELGAGLYIDEDLEKNHADWVEPLTATMFGTDVHTIGPNSQGYLTLGGGLVADELDLPDDPDDERWAHLLVEAAKLAGFDRPDVLHEQADGPALLDSIRARRGRIDAERASNYQLPTSTGDTTYLCTAEVDGLAVSLIQSNAAGFGSWLVEPNTGINLHNRGLGFNLDAGHPAEYGPGRRPPHTLSPALATGAGDVRTLVSVFGTMGGDAQPQILLQIAARLFRHGHSPAAAINAPRWALAGPRTGFDTWLDLDRQVVDVEGHSAPAWTDGLARRGHLTRSLPAFDSDFGHAHAIVVDDGLAGAADPRTRVGAVIGR